ncbi:MAG: inorganic phosphate transporter [Anaerobiospirillum succiniciproducens]|uniref:inorganic phosphate transporter n=1 Tax=Anaerobiospirillum succiniciproducens TaxID=13335 RepID=UPI002A74B6B0|nr:inorganic phosphate transporter [Anaerobiospirillum succiniciproducens]MDY2797818.1 inorganic phosphate transporter [Anaerobiospirillum succiniciproducens]
MIETIFIVLVGFLLLLACIDLFVGVSNDAVNFLNSAVGCRIAPLQVVLVVASLGVLIGATFSSGMMEVARSGMFRPEMFSFYDVMLIFCAVMMADVLLLNTFNSLGLPTSTTVSIVFELLGAAVMASAYKLSQTGMSYTEIFVFIKTERAATIVSAILISVVVAFFSGAIIQFILRLLFSFRFQNAYKYLGGVFCGFSVTAIVYFLVMKGAKGASFMKPEYIEFINQHTSTLLWTLFISLSLLGQILVMLKFNVFKIIILAGTFALAFSFAGNDLVNFVGVPLAALDAFVEWTSAGHPDMNTMMMSTLNENTKASTLYLGLAGLIMVVTLWTSKKAHRVIQTSINLSSSSSGEHEQFGASTPGRMVTRFGLGVARAIKQFLPNFLLAFIGRRYVKAPVVKGEIQLPFDYVRASVNLVLASILIASATSLKLPLSTTYVTFMVAMGTSFADGAWSRESAVYRISGVITVIAGWFLTAMTAFTAAALVTLAFFSFGFTAIFLLMFVVLVVIIRSNFVKAKTSEAFNSVIEAKEDNEKVLASISHAVPAYFDAQLDVVDRALENFFADNEFKLRRDFNKASNIEYDISKVRSEYYTLATTARSEKDKVTSEAKHFFYLTFSNMREASKAIRYMVKRAINHVANRHTIFQGEMQSSLLEIVNRLHTISADLHKMAANPTAENVEAMVKHAKKLNRDIDRSQVNLVNIIGREHVSMHSAEMYLGFLQGIRDLANRYVAVAMQERALSQIVNGKTIDRALNNSEMRSHVFGSTTRTGSEAMVISSVEEDDAAEAAKLQVSSDGAAAADAVAQAAAKAAEATVPADHADDHADEAEEKAKQAEATAADQKTDSVSDKPQA